jgi:hypothetical protein
MKMKKSQTHRPHRHAERRGWVMGRRAAKSAGGSSAWRASAAGCLCVAVALVSVMSAARHIDPPPVSATTLADAGDLWQFTDPGLDDEACIAELRRCCCCPDWSHYVIFDALFLQRSNQIGDRPLVFDADTGAPVIGTQSLYPSIGTGVRVFYGQLLTERLGWEVGYTGLYGMFGDAFVTGDGNLEMADPLGLAVNNFNNADAARVTYLSTLNLAEANLFVYDCCETCGPRCRRSCHCVNWLAGFVWAGLDEQAGISMAECCPPEPASYTTRTNTNWYGAQIGMRGRREWCRWAVEGWWKTALCGTSNVQSADPIIGSISGLERPAESASTGGVGFIGSLNGTAIYRINETWGLRAGYNVYWLTGAAFAPSQWDFATDVGAGQGINRGGTLFLHGANLGAEARW